jgi:methionyl aminopeptidase
MRRAGRLAAEILDALAPLVQPGVTTEEIDDLVRQMTLDGGAMPATLGYRGYAHSCCTRSTTWSVTAFRADKAARRRYRQHRRDAARSMAGTAIPAACIWSATCR